MNLHGPCHAALFLESVVFELAPERGAPDPERVRGSRMIEAVPLQDLDDVSALHVRQRLLRWERWRRPQVEARTHVGRQIGWLDRVFAREDGRPLDGVLELAHIARPGVPEKPVHGAGAQAESAPLTLAEAREEVL